MLEPKLPKSLNAERMCRQNENLQGQLLIEDLPRLQSMQIDLCNQPVEVFLEFRHDESQQAIINGVIKATVNLHCQRCMQPFLHTLDSSFHWGLVRNDEQAKQIQCHYDPIIVLANGILELNVVLEDEIILNIPIIPMHKNKQKCSKVATDFIQPLQASLKTEKHFPFTKLAELTKNLRKTK